MNRRQRKKKKAQVFTIILGCTAFCKAEQYEKMRKSVEYQLRTGSVVMLPAYLHVEAIIKQRGGRNIEIKQEETKTTAATGVEMPPEAESWVQLHESELTELMQKQAKAAITELKRQEKQERKKEKYHNTFTLMKCYRDAVFHIENAISDGQQLELKGMTDEQQRTYLESIRRTRFKTLIMTAHIDKAVEEIERRREAAGRGVEYKAFEMYFMQGMDYAEIAEQLDTGKNTPRRWVTGIINELSVLLWGIDEERTAGVVK